MKKNTWIIIIVLVIIVFMMKPEITLLGVVDEPSESTCNSDRNECIADNWPCCAPCVKITSEIVDCYESKTNGDNWLADEMQEWAYIYSSSYDCDTYYTSYMNNLYKAIYECFYGSNGQDCSSLKSTALSSITTWANNPTQNNKDNAITAIVNWAQSC